MRVSLKYAELSGSIGTVGITVMNGWMTSQNSLKWMELHKTKFMFRSFNLCNLPYISPQVRDEANKAGVPPARESIWQYFVNKCANNLHIVLAMSPVGETLRTRCRNFPGLVNNCSIDWFTAWPQQALHAVASVFLGENVSWIYW